MYLVLVVLLALLWVLSFKKSGSNPVAPSALFIGGFLISSLTAMVYSEKWGVSLGVPALLVVAVGNIVFAAVAYGVRALHNKYLVKRGARGKHHCYDLSNMFDESPSAVNYAVIGIVQIAIFFITLVYIQQRFPDMLLGDAIRSYNAAETFTTEDMNFPAPFRQIRGLVVNGGYVVAFFAGREIARGISKGLVPPMICLVLSVALILELGTRTEAVVLAICVGVAYFLERKKMAPDQPLLNRKIVLCVVLTGAVGLLLFKYMAVGREVGSYSTFDYLAEYVGAEIPNLDTFLTNTDIPVVRDLPGYMTFANNYGYLGEKLGIDSWVYTFDLPFLRSNGYDMGNVYTTFYAYLYDFGYWGLVPLVALMAACSQLTFELAFRRGFLGIACGVLYGKMASTLLLSFFSNKFYEVFYLGFVVAAACMALFYFLFMFPSRRRLDAALSVIRGLWSRSAHGK